MQPTIKLSASVLSAGRGSEALRSHTVHAKQEQVSVKTRKPAPTAAISLTTVPGNSITNSERKIFKNSLKIVSSLEFTIRSSSQSEWKSHILFSNYELHKISNKLVNVESKLMSHSGWKIVHIMFVDIKLVKRECRLKLTLNKEYSHVGERYWLNTKPAGHFCCQC